MRKNYFAKLVRYMKNVYNIENRLNKLSDERVNPTYSTAQVVIFVILGFLLRIKRFNELNLMIKNNEFSKLFPRGTRLPLVDAIRDTLKVIDISCPECLRNKAHCFHSGAVMSIVGDGQKLVIDFENYKPGQDSASNILQLFLFRRLRKHFSTQREVVRLLLKGLYLMKYKSELVFYGT